MASASFQLSSDDGSTYLAADTPMADANALAYVSSGTYSCKAKLASTAGVGSVQWAITSADDVHYDALPTVTTNPDKSCSFVVPKTGGAWLLRCIVNGGVNLQTGAGDGTLDRAMAVKVLNSAGNQEIAVGEQQEADAETGYTKAWNTVARNAGAPGSAILAATESALTAADTGSLANGTRAYVASHRSTWHIQTGDTASNVAHERIAGSTDGRVWQRDLVRSAYYEQQADWWVDPASGSDEATGATSGAPIKTLKELLRRVAPTGVWYVARAVTVNLLNDNTGHTLPDVTIHTGTGAVTVSIVGWEANPTVHTAYTVDTVVAPDPATNQRDTATMTAAVSDWTVGDIVRDETAGGDSYFVIGYIDGGVPERVELCQGVDSLGNTVSDPSVADVLRRVELAPVTLGGIRVIGGATVKMSLLSVDSANKATSTIDGVEFKACKLANVRLGRGSSASGSSFGGGCGIVDCHYGGGGTEGTPGTLTRCYLGSTFAVHAGNVDLVECYLASSITLLRGASVYAWAPNQVRRPAGSVFDWNDFGCTIDLSQPYSLYGSANSVFGVGGQVCGGMIRMLTDGTSVSFASGTADLLYASTGDDPQLFYPRPGSTAGNYPSCGDIINCADWVAAPFNGQIARNFYCDLMIVPVESAS